MPVAIAEIPVRQGEDVYTSFTVVAGTDLTDWSTWDIAMYIYGPSGTLITTLTIGGGTVVKTSSGNWYTWLKKSVSLTMARQMDFWQCRRIDADHDTVLAEGPMPVTKYAA